MGMIIDVSHLNDEGFWDVMEIAKKPIIASHSNCRSLASSMRNLTDEQIKAIASINGVIEWAWIVDKKAACRRGTDECKLGASLYGYDHTVRSGW